MNKRLILLVAFLLSGCASTTRIADESQAAVPRGAPLEPVQLVEPPYPPDALASCHGGKVVLSFLLSLDGRPFDIRADSASSQSFADSAYVAIRRWVFKPPLPSDAGMRRFKLPLDFIPPESCEIKDVQAEGEPANIETTDALCEPVSAVFKFRVEETGNVTQITIKNSDLPLELEAKALEVIRRMSFEPRLVDGSPVARMATMPLSFTPTTCE